MAHIILFGNAKGGSGKTTIAMHLIVTLLKLGFKVASMDIDIRQASLTSYIKNRKKTSESENLQLSIPVHFKMMKDYDMNKGVEYTQEDIKDFESLIKQLNNKYDFIIIDTSENDNILNRYAHYLADTIITPINDSFLDVDLLCKVDHKDYTKAIPSIYSSMIWEQKKHKASKEKREIDWIVVRNRLPAIDVINKKNIASVIAHLGKRLGFFITSGFGDRVIFKELFLNGLTLLDTEKINKQIKINPSITAARQELREFISSLKLIEVNKKLQRH